MIECPSEVNFLQGGIKTVDERLTYCKSKYILAHYSIPLKTF